jgi:DNA-binding transcriptional regulator LsrR (DeoR family)
MNRMNGEEIAASLKISRQAVSNALKRGMEKLFLEMKRRNRFSNDFEIAMMVLESLDCLDGDVDSVRKDFNLFPPKIKERIKIAAEQYMRHIEDEDDFDITDLNKFFGL